MTNVRPSKKQADTRRQALQKIAYAAPIIATMVASPAFAQTGSIRRDNEPNGRAIGWHRRRAAVDKPSSDRQV